MIWTYKGGKFDLSKKGVIMGILNVTPDSFSDGGQYNSEKEAVKEALKMVQEGAEIIDVGGESTRPGAEAVSLDEELGRTIPIIEALRNEWDGAISIDTSKPEVAHEAIQAGANIVNDVTGLKDPEMVLVCRDGEVGVVVMHMKGTPRTMQESPSYNDVNGEIKHFFQQQYEMLTLAGIPDHRICFDPGIGFGKTVKNNTDILSNLTQLQVEQRPLLIGLSRKSFIGKLLESDAIDDREWSTVALTAYCRKQGAMLHRVHAIKENYEAIRMVEAIMHVD